MSEYQYYEFIAIDRPLNDREQAEVRSLSTRAKISATSFVNEYEFGDFHGSPRRMMEHFYDAHLYFTNWGTRRVMFRMPKTLLVLDDVAPYCDDDHVAAWATDSSVVLELTSEDESGDWDYTEEPALGSLIGIRDELTAGDFRALYLAWLAGQDPDEFIPGQEGDDDHEPPTPAGLGSLTAPQRALADFFGVDDPLLAEAADSAPDDPTAADPAAVAAWVERFEAAERKTLLRNFVETDPRQVRAELFRRYRNEHAGQA